MERRRSRPRLALMNTGRWLLGRVRDESRKAMREGPMSYQLVGEVMAHQGSDG